MDKKELAVGDSTRVKLIFSTGHYSSRVTKSARIICNAAGRLPRLTISADVQKYMDSLDVFTLEPYSLNLDADLAMSGAMDYTFTLKNLHDTDLEFTVVSMPYEMVDVDLPDNVSLDAGEERQFKIRFGDNVAGELFTESITFEANDPANTRMTIPIVKSRRWGPAPTSSLH
ncbi:MAG: hypothetical protein GF341_05345 [candidate division Zixibacteria bacterium]|nr:hypothetical protein [candidate division Zixibacteria bacterium]